MPRDYNNQGIYMIKNKINGKCYIGQSIDLERRWKQHYKYNVNFENYPLYRSFKKHGIENFEFIDLEYVENFEDLTSREMYWYNKIKPEYNQIIPTNSNVDKKSVYKIDLETLKILEKFDSILEASKKTKLFSSNISKVCNNYSRQTGGFAWCFVEKYNKDFKPIYSNPDSRAKKIRQIKNNKIIKIFSSIKKASEHVGVHYSSISKCLRGRNTTSGGYHWEYLEGGEDNSARL